VRKRPVGFQIGPRADVISSGRATILSLLAASSAGRRGPGAIGRCTRAEGGRMDPNRRRERCFRTGTEDGSCSRIRGGTPSPLFLSQVDGKPGRRRRAQRQGHPGALGRRGPAFGGASSRGLITALAPQGCRVGHRPQVRAGSTRMVRVRRLRRRSFRHQRPMSLGGKGDERRRAARIGGRDVGHRDLAVDESPIRVLRAARNHFQRSGLLFFIFLFFFFFFWPRRPRAGGGPGSANREGDRGPGS